MQTLLDRLDQPDAQHGTVAAGLFQHAKAAGFVTSIDVVSEDSDCFASVVQPALKDTDYAILNEFEAERTTGLRIRAEAGIDSHQLNAAARELLGAGVREWVVIHFPEGAMAASKDGRTLRQGSVRIPMEKNVGSPGAGDAFDAGLLYGLHEGKPTEECLRSAVCVAAASLTEANCSGGIQPLPVCLQIGKAYGFGNVAD